MRWYDSFNISNGVSIEGHCGNIKDKDVLFLVERMEPA